jgi:hypothetical protein
MHLIGNTDPAYQLAVFQRHKEASALTDARTREEAVLVRVSSEWDGAVGR